MALLHILSDTKVLLNCAVCGKSFKRLYDCTRHCKSVHSGAAKCLLCGLIQKSAVRRDMKIRHLTRCERFKKDCLSFGITHPALIKKKAQDMNCFLFEKVKTQPYGYRDEEKISSSYTECRLHMLTK